MNEDHLKRNEYLFKAVRPCVVKEPAIPNAFTHEEVDEIVRRTVNHCVGMVNAATHDIRDEYAAQQLKNIGEDLLVEFGMFDWSAL